MRRPTSRQTALLAAALLLLLPLFAVIYSRVPRSDPHLLAQIHGVLATNRQSLDLSDSGAHFDASLIDTQGMRIFLLGESHGIGINEDLDFDLLRYLHRTAHVRIYFPEMSYAHACLLNRYLETGDEDLLEYLLGESHNTPMWTREHRKFIRTVRAWNCSLYRKDRIRMVGVDVEHQPRISMRFLSDSVMAANREAPGPIEATVSRLRAFRGGASADVRQIAEELLASIQQHRPDYLALLGDGLFDFEMVADNLDKSSEFYDGRGHSEARDFREHLMYDTFRRIYPRLAGANLYGRWGADHIIQRPVQGHEPFAAKLNCPESPAAGHIVSIQPIYQHSYGTISNGKTYQDYDATPPNVFLEPFAPLAQGSVTLFRITGASSLLTRDMPFYPLGEGVQYVVFIRDAAAAHPLGLSKKLDNLPD